MSLSNASLGVGGGGAAAEGRMRVFMAFIRQNMEKAVMMKVKIACSIFP